MELRILRQLEGQHRTLMRRRRAVEQELSALADLGEKGEKDEARVARAMSMLTALHRELREHFALEEGAGFLQAATQAAPRLSRRARQLRHEHGDFDAAVARILDELLSSQTAPERWGRLAEAFARFSEAFLAHEKAEEEIVREAFMDDLGGGD